MDRNNRGGAKPGGGFLMTSTEAKMSANERRRKLANEIIDLTKDPYFYKTVNGTFECKLCITSHNTEGNYLSHTQGVNHKQNLKKRMMKEEKEKIIIPEVIAPKPLNIIKIGKPGYKIIKNKDINVNQNNLYIEVYFDQIYKNTEPMHKIISCYEQIIEDPDPNYQYILIAGNPYETIAVKIPNIKIDTIKNKIMKTWDNKKKLYILHVYFIE